MKNAESKQNIKIILSTLFLIFIGVLSSILIMQGGKSNSIFNPSALEIARSMEYRRVQAGEEIVEGTDENVHFDAFFLRDIDGDGVAESLRGTCREIGKQDTLYMEINVLTEGYLKDGRITINGKNFYLATALPKDAQLKNNYIGNNVKSIALNAMDNGTQKLIIGTVRSGDYTYTSSKTAAIGANINNYSRDDNEVVLTGTYVNGEGQEISIEKRVPLTVDWHGTTKARISTTNLTYSDIDNRISEEAITLDFKINTEETVQALNLSKNYTEGTIPRAKWI